MNKETMVKFWTFMMLGKTKLFKGTEVPFEDDECDYDFGEDDDFDWNDDTLDCGCCACCGCTCTEYYDYTWLSDEDCEDDALDYEYCEDREFAEICKAERREIDQAEKLALTEENK